MADNLTSSGGGNSALAFLLDAALVGLGILVWVVFGGGFADEPDIRLELPGGGAIEGEVEGR